MRQEIMIIQSELMSKYLDSFKNVENEKMKEFYEMMVKLNSEMIGQALQMYDEKVNEKNRNSFR